MLPCSLGRLHQASRFFLVLASTWFDFLVFSNWVPTFPRMPPMNVLCSPWFYVGYFMGSEQTADRLALLFATLLLPPQGVTSVSHVNSELFYSCFPYLQSRVPACQKKPSGVHTQSQLNTVCTHTNHYSILFLLLVYSKSLIQYCNLSSASVNASLTSYRDSRIFFVTTTHN